MTSDLASSFSPSQPLALIGAGKMGGALLAGWVDRGLDPGAVVVVDPSPPEDSKAILAKAGIAAAPSPPDLVARVIVVAVKPQIIAGVLPEVRRMIGPATVVLSIAAGSTLANLEAGLGPAAIVRSIPNTPAQVEAVGVVAWVADEALIEVATAVSGSGPAYVFLLVECLAEAALAEGLPAELADRLARATVSGAGELLEQSDLSPAQLRKNVTSPNGTTAAALGILMGENGLAALMRQAVAAARRRTRELSG
jgi:pyrroline-5-carboxylate reductase